MGNNPVGYNDPSGHMRIDGGIGGSVYTPKPKPRPKPKPDNVDLILQAGLGANSCTNNACTPPSTSINDSSTPPNTSICQSLATCQYNYGFGNYTYDFGGVYISSEVDASATFQGPNGSNITIANDGGEMDFFGFDFDRTVEMRTTSVGIGLGKIGHVNYTFGSGFSLSNFALEASGEIEYSLNISNNYQASGTARGEIGTRPHIFALEFAVIRTGVGIIPFVRNLRIPDLAWPNPGGVGY